MTHSKEPDILSPMNLHRLFSPILLLILALSVPVPAGAQEFSPSNPPPDMVYIPAGPYVRGGQENDNERPFGLSETGAYFIHKTEVTNASFALLMSEHKFPRGQANFPATNVTYIQAEDYGKKLSRVLGYKLELPTEDEWEKAARGTEQYLWPWGGIWDPDRANASGEGPEPVGSYPSGASPYGALDMIGNVWEWTRTPWTEPGLENPRYPQYVLKGGSWWAYEPTPTAATRYRHAPEVSTPLIGFRLVHRYTPPARTESAAEQDQTR